jgi:hypothetical protein
MNIGKNVLSCVGSLALLLTAVPAQPPAIPVAVTLALGKSGAVLPDHFTGFSYERNQLLPAADGVRYFRPDNHGLIELFRTLGIRSLRIGGNTSDRDATGEPQPADFESLFAFARAANVKVIYCLRMLHADPQAEAKTAKHLTDYYGELIDCFSIGQEASAYPVEKLDSRPTGERMGGAAEEYPYTSYRAEWKRFQEAIVAAVPNVRLCGPSIHNNAEWARRFMVDFGAAEHVALITEHLYPGGAGGKVPTPEIGRDRMLSAAFTTAYQKLHDGFVPTAVAKGLPYRLEETNNYFNGGAADVSNTYASALWSLDYLHWWANHGAAGINFHTGDRVAAGNTLQVARYAAFVTTPGGFEIRPLSYGMKAFELGGQGALIPVTLEVAAEGLNVSAYAMRASDGAIALTIINKEHGPSGRSADVRVLLGEGYRKPQLVVLSAPAGDVAAKEGITLGGGEIDTGGTWRGRWSELPELDATGALSIEVSAATAVIVRCPVK